MQAVLEPRKKPIPFQFVNQFNAATQLLQCGRAEEAERKFEECARQCPEAWLGIACSALEEGRFEEAMARFGQVLKYATHPKTRAVTLNNIGTILCNQGYRAESRPYFEQSFAAFKNEDAAANLAQVLNYLGEPEAGLKWINRAISMNARNHQFYFTRALILLLLGRLEEGFADYESRWKASHARCRRLPVFRKEWLGEPMNGRTMMVYAEQGAGDTIQMLRYGPELKRRGAGRLLLFCQKGVGALAKQMGCWDEVYEDELLDRIKRGDVPHWDVQCPTMTLPLRCGLLWDGPYLPAGRMTRDAREFRIGFVWAGSVDHAHDRWRSTKPEQWLELFPLAKFYSFQVGPRTLDAIGLERHFTDLSPLLETYADTADWLAGMDLIISVDTSVVHLAGAMGKPVWMLTPFCPDWRWMLNREDSPWYPSVRLFRQPKPGDWESVFKRIKDELSRNSH